jgi:hypothetical protein
MFTLIAMIAAGALGATASAVPRFTAGEYPAILEGQGKFEFDIFQGERTISCSEIFEGPLFVEPIQTFEVNPTYSNCKHLQITSPVPVVTVEPNKCTFRLHLEGELKKGVFGGSTDLVCPEGKKLTTHFALSAENPEWTCVYTIGSQNEIASVEVTNIEGSPNTVTISAKGSEVVYESHGSIFLCGGPATTPKALGTLTIESSVIATNESSEQVALFVD